MAQNRRQGFTLIEMLVSLAITLIMMGAVVTLFGTITDSVSGSRSIIEISERLRATRNRLQADLQGATATMKPPLRPENDEGYFEIIEGPMQDKTSLAIAPPNKGTAMGDVDDVLMFTVRSRGEPFVGKYYDYSSGKDSTFESQVAEVMYYCAPSVNDLAQQTGATLYIDPTGTPVRTVTLYRRVLLIAPGVAQSPSFMAMPINPIPTDFYDKCDLSARVQRDNNGKWRMVANSLGDVTKREFRFGHNGPFPFDLNLVPPVNLGTGYVPPLLNEVPHASSAYLVPFFAGHRSPPSLPPNQPPSPRYSDDILLTNILSFDVQVYDPGAPVNVTPTVAQTPSDPNYSGGGSVVGAYVDLGWQSTNGASFSQAQYRTVTLSGTSLAPNLPSSMDATSDPPTPTVTSTSYTFDTWSLHYENNGFDDDDGGTGPKDEGTDGLDDATAGVVGIVDDAGEMETRPPFAAQLRGLRVTIRVYEPSSQQIRQMTVVGDFLPD